MFATVNKENNVFVSYFVHASNGDFEKLASAIARHSSIGVNGKRGEDLAMYAAKVADIQLINSSKAHVSIAYPLEILETDNLPQLLSVISSNAFGVPGIDKLIVSDVEFPDSFISANRGPVFGITGIRDRLRIHDRPLISTVIKPKVGNNAKVHAKLAYEAFVGGVDIVRDDENLADIDINPFYERVSLTLQALREAERVTGEKKMYVPNMTARISEMYGRAKFIEEMGGTAGMIDVAVVGISGVQFMRDQELDLCLYGHRIMDGSHLNEDDGVSALVLSKILRLAGIDMIHLPSLKSGKNIKEVSEFLRTSWNRVYSVFPVLSGGLHIGHLEKLLSLDGNDQIINMGTAVFGHPDGAESGARAFRQALEGVLEGKTVRNLGRNSIEVKRALDKWGVYGEESYEDLDKNTNIYPLVKAQSTDIVPSNELLRLRSLAIREEN